MAAEFRLWSATLADPAEEAAFRIEHAASFRRNALLSIGSAWFFYFATVVSEPVSALRDGSLWPVDATRLALVVTGIIAFTRIIRDGNREVIATWSPLFWTIMAAEFAAGILLDPFAAFDGIGGVLALLLILGYAVFSATCAIDFRWAVTLIGLTVTVYVCAALFGQAGSPPIVRHGFAAIMAVAGAGLLGISHGLRYHARRQFSTLRRERRLVAELDAARAAAERANAVKSRFVATMSHEFRTPLNAILGMAELLAESRLDVRQRQYVDLLGTAAEHLGGLLGDILDFSRIEADRITLAAEPFDPGAVVREVIEFLSSETLRKGLTLKADLASSAPRWCLGDPLRLRQVLLNLVGNALCHTERGGVTVRLEPAAGDAAILLVTVEDTGSGIPEAARATIFEPSMQAGGTNGAGRGGLGLGLAISRRLVGLMGGRLWYEAREGGGSRFRFTAALPVLGEQPEPVPAAQAAPAGPLPVAAVRILLADDSVLNRVVVAEHLAELSVSLDQVADGAEALARFKATPYDAVLLDIRMPVLDGLAAVRGMRRLEAERGHTPVPVIALTAGVMWEEREAAMAAGCTAFLAKPVRRRVLLQVLAEHLPGLGAAFTGPSGEPDAQDLTGRFLAAVPAALARMRAAATQEDGAAVAREAHALHGAALVAGLTASAARLGAVEATARTGGAAVAAPLREAKAVLDGLAEGWRPPPREGPATPEPVRADPAAAVRILLAEDHALVRDGIRSLLAGDPRFTVVGEAGDGLRCVREACRLEPELVIIDLMMPHMTGRDAIAEIKRRRPRIKVLVLTAVNAPEPVLEALRAGADGVVHKSAVRDCLYAAIDAVRAGVLYLSEGVPLAVGGRSGTAAPTVVLSTRERQVLKLLIEGKRNREIGDLLAISPKTVEKHRASLMKKLGVDSAAELASHALRLGLIEATD